MISATDRAAARTLQALLLRAAVSKDDYPKELGQPLVGALHDHACRELTDERLAAAERTALDRRFCTFLATILSQRGPDIHTYLRAAVRYGPQGTTGDRHHCGNRLLRMSLLPRWLKAGERWLDVCERCGMATNQPAGGPSGWMAPAPPGRVVIQLGRPVTGGWYTGAVQHLGEQYERPLAVRAIPTSAATFTVDIPPCQVGGLRRWAVAVVTEADYHIFQLPLT